jgi:predicted TPR repeat methyltransferase
MANARLDDDPLGEAEELIAAGQPQDAVDVLERLHEEGRGGLLLQTLRVRALIAADRPHEAVAVAREAAVLHPSAATAIVALGDALLAAGHVATAIGEFQRALRIDPDLAPARFALGTAWLAAGEAEKAAEAFAEIAPEDAPPQLEAKLAEIEAMKARARSDARYVRHLFDQFSHDYDARMIAQLGYGAPLILRDLAGLIGLQGPLAILDLGCGTGLAGVAFSELAARLDGIDLSPRMIEKAKARGLYDALHVGDIEATLHDAGRIYDLILAADTLVYLGDLAPVLRGGAAALVERGHFLFTVERKDGDGFELGPKRRWRHSETYLRAEAERAGFDVAGFLACTPRTEAGAPVEGYAVALAKL